MQKKIALFFCISLLLNTYASELHKPLTVYGVPCLYARFELFDYIKLILPDCNKVDKTHFAFTEPKTYPRTNVVHVSTPRYPFADLGQDQCMKRLHQAIEHTPTDNGCIYALSQGAATALNYVAHNECPDIKSLLLEGTVASGNSAICYSVKKRYVGEWAAQLPAAYYWTPYLVKGGFPTYWPGGKQPIKSIDRIVNTDKVFILMHARKDLVVSYDDSCALYYGLHKNGNKNTYLISSDLEQHVYLLQDSSSYLAVRTILSKHGIAPNKYDAVDLAAYQPDPEQFRKQYEELRAKETKHELLKYGLVAAAAFAAGKLLYKRVPQFIANIALKKVAAVKTENA